MSKIQNGNQPRNGAVIFRASASGVTAIEVWEQDWSRVQYRNWFYHDITDALNASLKMGWDGALTSAQNNAINFYKRRK